MKLYSTRHEAPEVDLDQAVKTGLPPDNGLYMPERIPALPPEVLRAIPDMPFNDLARTVLSNLFGDYISSADLSDIIDAAFDFDAPVHWLEDDTGILELFHGPTLAFKDFGARFMGRLLEYFLRNEEQTVDILVATSGDTGSAVAHGFLDTHGIRVTILYPKGKVSPIQEMQFATLGRNIRVLEVEGTFDDCQRMVKRAFLDDALNEALTLSSANSINIARLIPQSLYYFRAWAQLKDRSLPLVFSVPSGNFGNLTAGLLAGRMGLPIHGMVAANNANDVFTQYWKTGTFEPRPSVQTLSNAMDVGDPSNFMRILDLYHNDWAAVRRDITAYTYSDEQTRETIREVYRRYGYILCPHTAVGYRGLKEYHLASGLEANYIGLATAHPVKFVESVEAAIGHRIPVPERLKAVMGDEKQTEPLANDFEAFRRFLLTNS